MKSQLRILLLAILMGVLCSVFAEKPLHQRLGKGELSVALDVYNLWDVQPQDKQELLTIAYHFLEKDIDATYVDLAANAAFVAQCKKIGLTHIGGPILSQISENSAAIWVRTLAPAKVEIVVDANGKQKVYGPVYTTNDSDLAAVVKLDKLKPGKSYSYRLLINDKVAAIPETALIKTIAKKENTTIAFGSCWHRWGLNHPMMDVLRERNPEALLMIGDIAVQDRRGHLGLHRFDFLQRDITPRWQDFAATIPVYTGWDDHDYADNDLYGVGKKVSERDRQGIRQVFTESWANPQYGFEQEGQGNFLRTRIGPADVLMTDNRYFRQKGMGKDHFFGKEQLEWLKAQLLDCKGPFIILSCGTMWSDYVSNGKDSWGKYDPEGREEIFQLIEDNNIKGVLLISGDRHGARGFTLPRESGYTFYEFGGASFGGRIGPPAQSDEWTEQLYGIAAEYAFSEFEFNTSKKDPEVTFRLLDEKGQEVKEIVLKRSQLTPKQK